MGILDWMKGGDKQPSGPVGDDDEATWHHPVLGEMYQDSDTTWLAEEATTALADHPLEISVEGDDDGPDPDAIKAFEHFLANSDELRQTVEKELFAFYRDYFDEEDEDPGFKSAGQLWGTEALESIHFVDRENFDISYTFDWQVDGDDHLVTVYVEDGEAISHSIDG